MSQEQHQNNHKVSNELSEIKTDDSTKNAVEIITFLAGFPLNIIEAQVKLQQEQQAQVLAIEMRVLSYVLITVAMVLIINLIITIIASIFVFYWTVINFGLLLGIFFTILAGILIYIGVIVIPIGGFVFIFYIRKLAGILYQDITAFIYLIYRGFFWKKK